MNTLKGFDLTGGIAGKDGCHLWLTGEETYPTLQGVFIYSENGGLTLETEATWPQALHIWSMAHELKGTFWIAGDNINGKGLLLKSDDNGRTWREIPLPTATTILTAITTTETGVWVCGKDESNTYIFASTDEGNHWHEALKMSGPDLLAISGKGATVMAIGYAENQGVILISHDGGTNFQLSTNYGHATMFTGIDIIDPKLAYVAGYYAPTPGQPGETVAVLLQTTDRGSSFKAVSTPNSTSDVADVLFLAPGRGYGILNLGGNVQLFAVNSGSGNNITWESMPLVPEPDFGAVTRLFAADDGTVFAFGLGGFYRIVP